MARPNHGLPDRYLRNKVDGTIYHWNETLAQNAKCEEVTEQQAFPERFAKPIIETEAVATGLGEARKRTKSKPLAEGLMTTSENMPPEQLHNPDLGADASRNMPSIAGAPVAPPAPIQSAEDLLKSFEGI